MIFKLITFFLKTGLHLFKVSFSVVLEVFSPL